MPGASGWLASGIGSNFSFLGVSMVAPRRTGLCPEPGRCVSARLTSAGSFEPELGGAVRRNARGQIRTLTGVSATHEPAGDESLSHSIPPISGRSVSDDVSSVAGRAGVALPKDSCRRGLAVTASRPGLARAPVMELSLRRHDRGGSWPQPSTATGAQLWFVLVRRLVPVSSRSS